MIENWGLVDYKEALDRQLALVEQVQKDPTHETIVICRHPAVVTLGRATQASDIFGWQGETYEIQRGGRATYHGPSQLVVYPVLDLNRRGRDLHKYLRDLERSVIELLSEYEIESVAEEGATGVWVGKRKIASIGVGVKRWVTYHGLALNVSRDPTAFQGIHPCGFSTETMISLEEILSRPVSFEDVTDRLTRILSSFLFAPFVHQLDELF